MNHAHEALKRKIMEMHNKSGKDDAHSESEIQKNAQGDMHEHQTEREDLGDDVAGAAPSLKSHTLSVELGEHPALTAGIVEGSPTGAGEEHGDEEEMEEKIDPGIHSKILDALKSRGGSPLANKAHEAMMSKKAMIKKS